MKNFEDLGCEAALVSALAARSITIPTAVQATVLPSLYAGRPTLFRSETGTGKTLCYLLPAFRLASSRQDSAPVVLIIAPTHELASQIKQTAGTLAREAGLEIESLLCIGGAPLSRQIDALKKKPALIIGGPARIIELIRLKKLKTHALKMVVLDETDRLLSPELRDLTGELLSIMPRDIIFTACSATLGPNHRTILDGMITLTDQKGNRRHPDFVEMPLEDILRSRITHWAFFAEKRDKIDMLRSFLSAEKPDRALVFTAVTGQVDVIASKLRYRKVNCSALHARMSKQERKQAMDDFRAGRSSVLVTSDLAARGLDISGITHIIQMDLPSDDDFFIHRAGRTGRAGKTGINAVFGDENEMYRLSRLEKKLKIIVYPRQLYNGAVVEPVMETED